MGLLDGGLQRVALGAFGAVLLTGKFQRQVSTETRDDRGRIEKGQRPAPTDFKGFYETVTDRMRAEGYGNRDVQVVMLQLDPQGMQIPKPVAGDIIQLRGETHQVAEPISQDPAMASWTMRGTPTTISLEETEPEAP